MALHKQRFVRREWLLCKSGEDVWCEVWLDGADFELRLIRSGRVLVHERKRSDVDIQRLQRVWREDMMTLGWADPAQ